jgi:hypothetical protein
MRGTSSQGAMRASSTELQKMGVTSICDVEIRCSVTNAVVATLPDDLDYGVVTRFANPPREGDPDDEKNVPVECCQVWIKSELVHDCCTHEPRHSSHQPESPN